MPKDRDNFKLGLTLIVSVALFLLGVVFIGGRSFAPRDEVIVRIEHDQDVPQIKAGAPIVCGPQDVGSVINVAIIEAPALDPDGPEDFLFFEILASVDRAVGLRSDCKIVVEGSLLGTTGQLRILHRGTSSTRASTETPVYAEASGLSASFEKITSEFDADNPDGLLARIKQQLDPNLDRSIIARIHKSLEDVNVMTANLRMHSDSGNKAAFAAKVDSILTHVNTITAALRAQLGPGADTTLMAKVHRGLDRVDNALVTLVAAIDENRESVRNTVRSAEHVARTIDQSILPAVESELDRTRAESLLSQAHLAMEEINTSLADVHDVTHTVRRVTALSEDRVLTIIENAKEASDHLKAVAKDLRRSPWRLIHQPDADETKQSLVLDAVREFTRASAHLDESAGQLNALLEANHGQIPERDPTLQAIRDRLGATFEKFSAAEEALWKQLDLQ